MSRLDFFLVAEENRFYFNEVNTIPGFTPISQYPQLWAHSGIQGPELLQRLLDLAVERQTLESALVKSL
jgi:D-alanine-D-alanine ligase